MCSTSIDLLLYYSSTVLVECKALSSIYLYILPNDFLFFMLHDVDIFSSCGYYIYIK